MGSALDVLLITIDTLRADHLGCYSRDRRTPAIDRLARSGTVFDLAITNGSYTKTAFPAILSSTYASMHGGPFSDMSSERPMLARVMQDAAYETAGFTSNPLLGAHLGYDTGFDRFEEVVPPGEDRNWLSVKGSQALLRSRSLNALLSSLGVNTVPHPVYASGSEITQLGLEWLSNSGRPSFLWLHYMDTHWPYHRPEDLINSEQRAQAWRDRHIQWRSQGTVPSVEVIERLKRLYTQAVTVVDAEVGKLEASLRAKGRSSNTLVILTSDHGEAFYEHGRWQHGAFVALQDEILRVPLILAGPQIPAGRRVESLVGLIDIAPTILDLTGIPAPPKMEGKSLLTMLLDQGQLDGRVVISEMIGTDSFAIALRSERYKYIFDADNGGSRELYDLQLDPGEHNDMIDQLPETSREFERLLQDHLRRIDPLGRPEPGAWDKPNIEVMRRLRDLGYID